MLTVGKAGHETLVAEAPGNTVIERLNDSIYRAVASCGSPCSGAFYFDARSGRKAGFYPDWLVEDTLHLLIAYLDSTSQIVVRCIFECRDKEKRFSLPLGPSATPRTTIRNARFEGENLTVDYLAGERFDSVQAALRIPDELLTPH